MNRISILEYKERISIKAIAKSAGILKNISNSQVYTKEETNNLFR